MKKIIASIFVGALLLAGTQATAQVVVGAGYLHSIENTKNKSDGKAVGDPVHLNGFYVGASYNIRFSKYFGVAPGFYVDFLFQSKDNNSGGTFGGIMLSGNASYRYTEIDLNVPVNLTFTAPISSNAEFFAFAGPTFQYGVMARSTFSGSVQIGGFNYGGSEPYNHYGDKGDTNPFNIYLGGGIGFQVGDIQFLAGYDYGVMNMDKSGNYSTNRSNIKAGINFAF